MRGEVVVRLWTDQEQRLNPGSVLFARGEVDHGAPARQLRVIASRPVGGGRHIVHFDQVGDRTAAERLRGLELAAEPLDVPGTLWVHELVGAMVRDAAGTELGRIASVEANPASDLLVLESGGLIPIRFITTHDLSAGTVDVEIPEGLLEL